ncbi:MAG: methylated-DNA--[protein]-cysteine S-methyltransferase [Oscillospiraceae bacterium]|nr:methylated-DNA--[protein]-cysteine S-methyltransferase [Oscillospiraceae bacterium]
MEYTFHYPSPLGEIFLAGDGEHLTGLWLEGQKYFASTLPRETSDRELPVFAQTVQWLERYFAGKEPGPLPPLAPHGSLFRRQVWEILLTIPRGETLTYGAIAARMAALRGRESMSAQAVGGAVAHNPISILIPCHRVVGASGSLTGYAGGVDKKIALLRLEGVDLSLFFIPGQRHSAL